MCKYCERCEDMKNVRADEDNNVKCQIFEGYIQMSEKYDDWELTFNIKYCPMCGRKLNGNE